MKTTKEKNRISFSFICFQFRKVMKKVNENNEKSEFGKYTRNKYPTMSLYEKLRVASNLVDVKTNSEWDSVETLKNNIKLLADIAQCAFPEYLEIDFARVLQNCHDIMRELHGNRIVFDPDLSLLASLMKLSFQGYPVKQMVFLCKSNFRKRTVFEPVEKPKVGFVERLRSEVKRYGEVKPKGNTLPFAI